MSTEPVNKDLLCKNCTYGYIKWQDWPNQFFLKSPFWMKCKKTAQMDETFFNPVIGYSKKKPDYKSCYDERGRNGDCGPSAKNWSPKHKKDLFKVLTR